MEGEGGIILKSKERRGYTYIVRVPGVNFPLMAGKIHGILRESVGREDVV